jgi:hypothetical protein
MGSPDQRQRRDQLAEGGNESVCALYLLPGFLICPAGLILFRIRCKTRLF